MDNNDIDIYSDELSDISSDTITSVPFPSDTFVDDIFGGFRNAVFYDYLKLFFIMAFFIFCIKIFGIFFER